jgi:hypothetical protein
MATSIDSEIQSQLDQGRTPDEVVEGLIRKGLSEPTARRFVDRVLHAPSASERAAAPSTSPAYAAAVPTSERFSVGAVLGRSLRVWAANLLPFLVLTVVCYSPFIVYSIGWVNQGDFSRDSLTTFTLIATAAELLLGTLASGALTYGVVQQLRGHRASIGQCIAVGLARLLPILGVGLLTGLCILGGVLLLLIPGIIAACALWITVPVAVVEHPGVVGALKRSAALTRGHRRDIFAILFVLGLADFGVDKIIESAMLSGYVTLDDAKAYFYVVLGAAVLFGALRSAAQAVGYSQLRLEKDGVDAEQIARVFE